MPDLSPESYLIFNPLALAICIFLADRDSKVDQVEIEKAFGDVSAVRKEIDALEERGVLGSGLTGKRQSKRVWLSSEGAEAVELLRHAANERRLALFRRHGSSPFSGHGITTVILSSGSSLEDTENWDLENASSEDQLLCAIGVKTEDIKKPVTLIEDLQESSKFETDRLKTAEAVSSIGAAKVEIEKDEIEKTKRGRIPWQN